MNSITIYNENKDLQIFLQSFSFCPPSSVSSTIFSLPPHTLLLFLYQKKTTKYFEPLVHKAAAFPGKDAVRVDVREKKHFYYTHYD